MAFSVSVEREKDENMQQMSLYRESDFKTCDYLEYILTFILLGHFSVQHHNNENTKHRFTSVIYIPNQNYLHG